MVENMVGKKYGKLKVIRQYYKKVSTGENRDFCDCECDCGRTKEGILGKNIRRGLSSSCNQCGERLKRVYEVCHKTNKYDLSGEFGIGYDSNDDPFYFNLEDYEKIKDICWNVDNNGYAVGRINGKDVFMHNYLMGVDGTRKVDHENRKRNDNRMENLRISTIQQNNWNKETPSNNTSGIMGISWNKKNNKWESYLAIDGKRVHSKLYEKFDDAVYHRLVAEKEYFGEFAPQAHLFEEYGV